MKKTHLGAFQMKGLRKILRVSWTAKKTDEQGASILWSHHEETGELPGERDNARSNARCTKTRKTTHGLDGQHEDVDRTPRGGRVTEDGDKWRKYVHGVANRRIKDS